MDMLKLTLARLDGEAEALDLANSLNSLNGVENVQVDRQTRTVTVTYDRRFGSEQSIQKAVKGTGYQEERPS